MGNNKLVPPSCQVFPCNSIKMSSTRLTVNYSHQTHKLAYTGSGNKSVLHATNTRDTSCIKFFQLGSAALAFSDSRAFSTIMSATFFPPSHTAVCIIKSHMHLNTYTRASCFLHFAPGNNGSGASDSLK